METLTVALVGDPRAPVEGVQGGEIRGDHGPYSELPKITLQCEPHDTLLETLMRAASEFGVQDPEGWEFSPSWIAFYRPEDEAGYSPSRESPAVDLVDEMGRVLFSVWFLQPDVTIDALIRSYQRGALDGDPRRPYLTLRPGYGNGIPPNWSEYVVLLLLAREVLGVLADAHGAAQAMALVSSFARRLLARFRRTPEIVEEYSSEWQERGGGPESFELLIDRQPWNSEVLAALLGCEADAAEALLSGRGFGYNDETRLWQPAAGQEGRLMKRVTETIYSVDFELDMDSPAIKTRFREEITERVTEILSQEESDESANNG
jgi:hypothetical protein